MRTSIVLMATLALASVAFAAAAPAMRLARERTLMLSTTMQGGCSRRLLVLAVGLALAGAAAAEPIKVPELRAAASVSLDAEGIPLIKAQNELDLAFLQGYAHARDRFFQMDFNRRGASA